MNHAMYFITNKTTSAILLHCVSNIILYITCALLLSNKLVYHTTFKFSSLHVEKIADWYNKRHICYHTLTVSVQCL